MRAHHLCETDGRSQEIHPHLQNLFLGAHSPPVSAIYHQQFDGGVQCIGRVKQAEPKAGFVGVVQVHCVLVVLNPGNDPHLAHKLRVQC
jgi:hypothetical protein